MRTQPIRLPGRVLPLWTLGGGQLPGVQSRGSYNFRVARIASEDRRYLMGETPRRDRSKAHDSDGAPGETRRTRPALLSMKASTGSLAVCSRVEMLPVCVELSRAVVIEPLSQRLDQTQTTGSPSRALELPPLIQTAEGITRRVGVEIEFARLSARRAAEAIATELDGSVVEEDNHAFVVQGTRLGDVTVELDLRHTHPQRCGTAMRPRLGRRSAAWLGSVVSHIVPCEMVTAPLPVTRLVDVDPVIDVLRRAGATGRGTTLFASLGLHFNVETPALDAQTITAVLKAFALLEPWLRRNCVRNIHEWLTRFGEYYPDDYVRRIVAPDYWPNVEGLADDYLAANPTRKRDLDLLPLLLFLDEARVRARLPHEKIGSRPAFHYRLPHAYVGDETWSLLPDWNGWVAVERLAGDRDQLDELGHTYRRFDGKPAAWADFIDRLTNDRF